MKTLIGVLTCHKRRSMTLTQKETWVGLAKQLGIDVKFFVGAGEFYGPDEVATGTLDDYEHMTDKARVCYDYAYQLGYDFLFTCGDDTWVHPRRFLKMVEESQHDYTGHLRGKDGELDDDYASGGPGTLLSRKALEVLVSAPPTDDQAEDRWAGWVLRKAGFTLHHDSRLCLPAEFYDRKPWEVVSVETVRVGKEKVSMKEVHQACFDRSNILVAVVTCHKFYNQRAQACKRTWVKDFENSGIEVKFFVGTERLEGPPIAFSGNDTISLPNTPDHYLGLPLKTRAMVVWAYAQGYEHVLKVDDDGVVVAERVVRSGYSNHDYTGRMRGPSGSYPAPYCSGIGYWLSRKAMRVLIKSAPPTDTAEDRWVGNALLKAGIEGYPDYRYAVVTSQRNATSAPEGPRVGNDIIVAGEFHGTNMDSEWSRFKNGEPAARPSVQNRTGKLKDVCVMVKTFLRDGLLDRCLLGLEKNLPEAKIIVIDDGYESRYKITKYAQLRAFGHSCVWMPFDSGFGAKSNKALESADRKYLLIASDDFNFQDPTVRAGVEKLVEVLEHDLTVAVASGRVNGKAYEGMLDDYGDRVVERACYSSDRVTTDGTAYKVCELTVNFSLIRREVLGPDKIHWENDVKIGGGEHGAFFLDLKRAGHGVAWVPGVNITEQPFNSLRVDRNYAKYRARAREDRTRPCFDRRGVKSYVMFGGAEDINA